MGWTYFSQFWDSITSQVVGGVEYTIGYFQSIGNAVAGALGTFFDATFHSINDIVVSFTWIITSLKNIFLALLTPITYVSNLLHFFFVKAFGTPIEPVSTYTFSPDILEVFNTIPHWDIVATILGAGILVAVGVAGLKLLLRT